MLVDVVAPSWNGARGSCSRAATQDRIRIIVKNRRLKSQLYDNKAGSK